MSEPLIKIGLYDSVYILTPVVNLSVGSHFFRLHSAGNSLLSTVYVRNATGTVKVTYYDYGAGDDDGVDVGSEITLTEHPTLSANQTDRRVVTKIHNHLRLRVDIVGGSAEVGLLATVVADFPLSGNLFDGQTANLTTDGGLPIAVYDDSLNKFFLLRGNNGVLPFDPYGYGTVKVFHDSDILNPSLVQTIVLSEAVPVGKTWRLKQAEVVCRGYGKWFLKVNSAIKGGGSTSPAGEHSKTKVLEAFEATAGQTVEIAFTYSYGPNSMPVDAFLNIQEI
jgi:hypothetical protein